MEEKTRNNLDHLPSYFRDYLFNYVSHLKNCLNENLQSVILYGSFARGTWTKESDIDLFLIIKNDTAKMFERLTRITLDFEINNDLKNEKGETSYWTIQEISCSLADLNRFRTLFYDITEDGILIYDKNENGLKFIEKIKLRMKLKELKRVYINDRDFYWKRRDIKFGEIVEL